jgi:hypothetical protein
MKAPPPPRPPLVAGKTITLSGPMARLVAESVIATALDFEARAAQVRKGHPGAARLRDKALALRNIAFELLA